MRKQIREGRGEKLPEAWGKDSTFDTASQKNMLPMTLRSAHALVYLALVVGATVLARVGRLT
jgi:hypothetical protein